MRPKVNHRLNLEQDKVNDFWKEYKRRGFEIDTKNAGSYVKRYVNASLKKLSQGVYKMLLKDGNDVGFKIVSPETFMKTLNQIEEIVKYKLFK